MSDAAVFTQGRATCGGDGRRHAPSPGASCGSIGNGGWTEAPHYRCDLAVGHVGLHHACGAGTERGKSWEVAW